ncbi:response regulator transcription factor [Luteolibacter luteus]|jgi:FixJ family two-component response regulator|uniref:Response regulator transcription factor n=2 Tax=Luteolibacter luteus TaxID=2728835 RepID=A0A858RGQ7_9BACT|nr:response regulator transcription factor [Luteolibacter luteus]
MNMSGKTIHLIDDDEGCRRALSRLLRVEGYEVRDFSSAEDFLASCHAGEVDCLLLDVSLPGLGGLELQRRLVRAGARFPILFLTGNGDIPTAVQAIQAGAVDYLTKPVSGAVLFQAVRRALAFGAARKRESEESLRAATRFSRLTSREREVMERVVEGMPNKIIAADLGTCEQTVKVHRGRVMEKMEAESLADLIRMARHIEFSRKALELLPR